MPPLREIDQSTFPGRFAARLRSLRERKKLTGEQVAEKISRAGYSVSSRAYYAWEGAERQPPLEAFPAIAKVFGLKSPRFLLPSE